MNTKCVSQLLLKGSLCMSGVCRSCCWKCYTYVKCVSQFLLEGSCVQKSCVSIFVGRATSM